MADSIQANEFVDFFVIFVRQKVEGWELFVYNSVMNLTGWTVQYQYVGHVFPFEDLNLHTFHFITIEWLNKYNGSFIALKNTIYFVLSVF